MICQWCRRPKLEVLPGQFMCQYGCCSVACFRNRCIDCRQEFDTGRAGQDQCGACEQKEDARYRRESAGDETSHTGYAADMRKKGAARRVAEMEKR